MGKGSKKKNKPKGGSGDSGSRGARSQSARASSSKPRQSDEVGIGSIVAVHSLSSDAGRVLNGKRGVVLRPVVADGVDRFQVKVEGVSGTKALKPDNVRIQHPPREKDPHPEYRTMVAWQMQLQVRHMGRPMTHDTMPRKFRSARGMTYDDDPPVRRARKLVELLDKPYTGYDPAQTILYGEAAKFYSPVGEENLSSNCVIYQLEHIAGLMALAAMCQGEKCHAKGCGEGQGEAVVLAFLEAGPVPLDVFMDFMVLTPYIGPEDGFHSEVESGFGEVQSNASLGQFALTPDQTTDAYCNAMKGPLGVLLFAHCTARRVLFRLMEQHDLFPLLLERLLRLISREALGTRDGKVLGVFARGIVLSMLDSEGDMGGQGFINDLDMDGWTALGIDKLDKTTAEKLLQVENVNSLNELRATFRDANVPMVIVAI